MGGDEVRGTWAIPSSACRTSAPRAVPPLLVELLGLTTASGLSRGRSQGQGDAASRQTDIGRAAAGVGYGSPFEPLNAGCALGCGSAATMVEYPTL